MSAKARVSAPLSSAPSRAIIFTTPFYYHRFLSRKLCVPPLPAACAEYQPYLASTFSETVWTQLTVLILDIEVRWVSHSGRRQGTKNDHRGMIEVENGSATFANTRDWVGSQCYNKISASVPNFPNIGYVHRLISVASTPLTCPGGLAFAKILFAHAKILFAPPHHHFAHSVRVFWADSLESSLPSSLSAS